MGDSRIKDVSSLLSAFFDEEKIKRGQGYSDFLSSWPGIVGSRLAAHSRVADVDKGLLVVEAEHPGWIQLLQLRQSSILDEVAKRYPELGLRGIVFRLREKTSAPPTEPAGKLQKEVIIYSEEAFSPEEPELAANKAADIDDPEFTALFSSLKKAMQGKE